MDQALPLSLFDYTLPDACVAQHPVSPRHASRLMRLRKNPALGEGVSHHVFLDIVDFLSPQDVLVVNTTKVMPARLYAKKPTGGKVQLLLCAPVGGGVQDACVWEALGKPGSAFKEGVKLCTEGGVELTVLERRGDTVCVRAEKPLWEVMQAEGAVPLPPYVQREQGGLASDVEDYQTVFAQQWGAVAAPTASLHFTEEVLGRLKAKGVRLAHVVLHVGAGTFLPVRQEHAEDVRQHTMHGEVYEVPLETQQLLAQVRAEGGRVVAVGTTVLRALETWSHTGVAAGVSQLFIWPGFVFKCVDALVTNFHVPQSTLLMLVSAFAGRERVLNAYAEAIQQGYRFYSYGDAMLMD
jgi:S-adenosylmethionine:tRNA ribosyltransferase-isomerase